MGFPVLKNWSVKRSGDAMTLMGTTADGQLLKLKAVDIRNDDGTLGKTIATTADGETYELT